MMRLLAQSTAPFTTALPTAGNAAYGGSAPQMSILLVVQTILTGVFSILGVVFLLLIVYAGFLWMTAMGQSKKVDKAKDILIQSTIGLVVILSAYAISYTLSLFVQGLTP